MPKAPRGRKPKQKRNITGLRNQHQITPDALQEPVLAVGDAVIEAHDDIASEELMCAWTDEPDKDWDPLLEFDSLKPCWAKEEDEADAQGTDDEIAEDMEIMADGWDAADDTG
ncbi:hypothetical protein D9615_006651 [Tricholomella constricta]|uniref:Uncharacterized protein n=1 Tax=Tricholomella constricta TaxID=117010 RepID=A0A8H5M322_9AGAR|nr:hypothetical protein D9615_006651 [Tricholomella constricta]